MFTNFFRHWISFCYDFLRLRGFWLDAALFVPHRLFLYEVRSKYGSIQGYVDFIEEERFKKRRHDARIAGLL